MKLLQPLAIWIFTWIIYICFPTFSWMWMCVIFSIRWLAYLGVDLRDWSRKKNSKVDTRQKEMNTRGVSVCIYETVYSRGSILTLTRTLKQNILKGRETKIEACSNTPSIDLHSRPTRILHLTVKSMDQSPRSTQACLHQCEAKHPNEDECTGCRLLLIPPGTVWLLLALPAVVSGHFNLELNSQQSIFAALVLACLETIWNDGSMIVFAQLNINTSKLPFCRNKGGPDNTLMSEMDWSMDVGEWQLFGV